ncbi:MAG: septation protein IspZ [Proteobacteria bacterium]|nr:septation protein IspZ [Pseudomonadota bacterium]
MRQFIEFIPIALFVAVYFSTRDIYLATAVLMGGACIQVGYEYIVDREVSKRTQMIFAVIVVAGAATLAFRDDVFIKWKPTIVNWLLCGGLLLSQFVSRDNLIKKMLGEHMELPDHVWRNLAYGWSGGFFLAGALNLVVAYQFSTDFWVSYKLVGGFAISLFYMIVTMIYLVKGGYISTTEEDPAKSTD